FIAPFSSSFGSYSFWSISMNYGNGFFYLAEIGYFRLSQNGRFRLALTPLNEIKSGECYVVIAHFADGTSAMSDVMVKE
ncbi:MAG: hypothetical protein IK024_13875, partial [Treponema sp.]|nr:hypothetical protein [Treponema sp.]